MLDSTTVNRFNYNINAVSGTLRKSHPKSKITIRGLLDKPYIFNDEKPRLFQYDNTEIVVLQVMLIGDNKAIVEYVNKNDFEKEELVMKYVCDVCGWEYDEEQGYPEGGIAPGTKWEDVPEDFECPLCSVGKDQFSKVE